MIIKNNKTISALYKGTKEIQKRYKGTLVVYEAWKKLIASGVPPITLQKCKGVDLADYKIYGNSKQEVNTSNIWDGLYTTGSYYDENGNIVSNASIAMTNLLSLKYSIYDVICVAYEERAFSYNFRFNFFDENKNWLSQIIITVDGVGGVTAAKQQEITIPKNAKYINFSVLTKQIDKEQKISASTKNIPTPEAPIEIESVGVETSANLSLPNEYQQVEYIESTGEQWIDTKWNDKNLTKIELDFIYTGLKYNGSTTYYMGANAGNLITINENGYMNIAGANLTTVKATEGERYNVSLWRDENGKRFGIINGVSMSGTNASQNGVIPFNLFKLGGSETASQILGKMYSCKIYDNDVLVRDFIPCYRKSDNVIGMYDLVNNVFYTNQGTGTFLKGENKSVYKIPVKVRGKNFISEQLLIEQGFIKQEDGSLWVSNSAIPYGKRLFVNENKISGSMSISFYLKNVVGGANFAGCFPIVRYTDGTSFSFDKIPTEFIKMEYITPTDKTVDYISWVYGTGTTQTYIKDMQIAFGEDLEYEPYVEPITTNIYLNEPLRKIEDYADYIDFEKGKVVRKIYNEYIATVFAKSSYTHGISFVFLSEILNKPLVSIGTVEDTVGYAISNKFKKHLNRYYELAFSPNSIQTYITSSGGNRVAYTFNDKSISTVEQAQEKIGESFNVCYVLDEVIEELIELPNIPTFKGTTIIEVDTNILPSNMEVKYYGKE